MSASMNWMAWCCAMGTSNVLRTFAYSRASSNAAIPMPMACAAIPMRPPSKVLMAILTLAFLSEAVRGRHLHVLEEDGAGGACADPQLLVGLLQEEPGGLRVDDESGDPLGSLAQVRHGEEHDGVGNRPVRDPVLRAVDDVLVARRTAVVRCSAASLPACGSVSPKHPSFSPLANGWSQRSFCASVRT